MYTVKIRLRKPRRVFNFLCDDVTLRRDEACIVQTDRGPEWGVCVLPPEPCPPEMERRYNMRVLRKVDNQDLATHQFLSQEEQKAHRLCFERIRERKLPMKLVEVEYSFDKKKVVFYFTADERVDFRDLVRDLAHELRTRIELRHIQVRDEAKMVGGIGGCGRELCCTTWLNEFKPISMRMAKKQNLSLNPSKISGQCGRLLCCLSYENDQYEEARRRARQQPAPAEEAPRRRLPEPVVEAGGVVEDPTNWDPRPQREQKPPETPGKDGPPKKRRRRKSRSEGAPRGGGA